MSKRGLTTKEVFLPARVLEACDENWDDAEDEVLSRAVGEAMEHAYWHWRWVLALRQHKCRLVVVQLRDVQGGELNPHYQIGELFTLSGWHPERALVEATALLNESGDGLTFDLPVDPMMLAEWQELARQFEIDEESALETMACAMVLLDEAHDRYVDELGDGFYVATRGLEKDLDALVEDDFGRWSAETMQVVDKVGTQGIAQVFPEVNGVMAAVPVVYQPQVLEEDGEGDDDER